MAIDKKIDYVEQDGSLNFVKNSDSVTVPKKFKARKEAPTVKLAYITDAEAKMLKKKKPGTPHKGPKGIPSYDSFGSIDASGKDTGVSGSQVSAAETGGRGSGMSEKDASDFRSAAIAAGAGQRVNPGFFDSRNVVSPAELARAKAFNPRAFRAGRKNSFMDMLASGGIFGSLARKIGQNVFGLGKTYDQPTYDMSQFNNLGLMGQVPEDFEDEKISLTSFIKPKDTIGRVNLNDLEGLSNLDFLGRKNLNDLEGINTRVNLNDYTGINNGIMQVADATTFPTFDSSGISLIDRNTLRNAGYNDRQIKEAQDDGYLDQLIKDIQPPIGVV